MCTQREALSILGKATTLCDSVFPGKIKESYLYGSYARGDYHDESDVDILLTADILPSDIAKYRKAVAHISSELSLEHDITVSLTVKPFEQFERYSNTLPFYQNVKREGIRYAG